MTTATSIDWHMCVELANQNEEMATDLLSMFVADLPETATLIQELFESRAERVPEDFNDTDEIDDEVLETEATRASLPGEQEALDLMERSRRLFERMHAEDREEAIDIHEKIGAAMERGDAPALTQASRKLREMLFFMEGKPN